MSRWWVFFPGNVYAYGPSTYRYANEREFRQMLRESWGFKRLPVGTQVWRA